MNQSNPSFARSLPPRVAAEGRSLVVPPPGGAPATIPYQHQTSTGTERGRAHFGDVPVYACRCAAGSSSLDLQSGFSLSDVSTRTLGAGFGRRLFLADGRGGNPGIANINNAADHLLNNRSDRFPSHSKVSLRYGPEPMSDGAQKNGNGSQKDGVS